jgi:hypothetical protein
MLSLPLLGGVARRGRAGRNNLRWPRENAEFGPDWVLRAARLGAQQASELRLDQGFEEGAVAAIFARALAGAEEGD